MSRTEFRFADVGLEAALEVSDLRSFCAFLRHPAQLAVRMITTGVMLALLAGSASKLKIFGGSP